MGKAKKRLFVAYVYRGKRKETLSFDTPKKRAIQISYIKSCYPDVTKVETEDLAQ